MRIKELTKFIFERHAIYTRRQEGKPKPWTKDPILQQYRFCNVYRELDTVTQWIAKNWREPHRHQDDVWFAMVVARLVNWPDSLAEIGYPVPWNPKRFVKIMDARKAVGEKIFTGAYMIHADAHHQGSKAAYLAERVLTPLWKDRASVRPYPPEDSLQAFHQRLMKYRDMGSFMAAQVVADVKFTDAFHTVRPASYSADWWTWAAIGPGSLRGMNRLLNLPVKNRMSEADWRVHLFRLQGEIEIFTDKNRMPRIGAQDLQNVLCEWDKHQRVALGEGRPRSLYNGAKENTRVVMQQLEIEL